MDFSLTETERDLVSLCREFAQKEIAPRAPQAWEEARCPTDLLREMGALGLLGMLVPEEWGGIGMSTVGFVAAMVNIENSLLLAVGLAIGTGSALVAIWPSVRGHATLPWRGLATMLATILAVGIVVSAVAAARALRTPILPALKGD